MENRNRLLLLEKLADGQFHSGEVLGEEMGISRAAIAKHVKALEELGLVIFSVTGKGYKLAEPLKLLNKDMIAKAVGDVPVDVLPVIHSTNDFLMTKIRQQEELEQGYTVLAECQTAGKGRRGRVWQSPFGSHIYMSHYVAMEDGLIAASGMSLAIGVAIVRAVYNLYKIEVQLKWPNDVLYQGQKLAGVLVEAEGQSDGVCHLVVGVGVNVNMPEEAATEIEQAWCDLNGLLGEQVNRDQFVVQLLKELIVVIDEYKAERLQNLHLEWNDYNAFAGQQVDLISVNRTQTGRCLGIDSSGALLIENPADKTVQKVFGGEISLRQRN